MTPTLTTASAILIAATLQGDFITEQKKFPRVREAIEEKQLIVEEILKIHNLEIDNFELLFVAYKDEDKFKVYAKKKEETKYSKIKTYPICARSGRLGPKRKQGDFQVPEGLYHINRFNPASNFHLSLGINYPNHADRKKSKASNLGGDIFIHGACMTVGCIPLTDDKIKEVYLLAIHAKNNGQEHIPVYIFPFEMTDENMEKYKLKYEHSEELKHFWFNLKTGFYKFQLHKKALDFSISASGDYQFPH